MLSNEFEIKDIGAPEKIFGHEDWARLCPK